MLTRYKIYADASSSSKRVETFWKECHLEGKLEDLFREKKKKKKMW